MSMEDVIKRRNELRESNNPRSEKAAEVLSLLLSQPNEIRNSSGQSTPLNLNDSEHLAMFKNAVLESCDRIDFSDFPDAELNPRTYCQGVLHVGFSLLLQ